MTLKLWIEILTSCITHQISLCLLNPLSKRLAQPSYELRLLTGITHNRITLILWSLRSITPNKSFSSLNFTSHRQEPGRGHLFNPFNPKSDQCQISPAASPGILHHTVWRTLLFIAYSDWKIIMLPILTTSLIHFSLEGWENVLFSFGVKGLMVDSVAGQKYYRLESRGLVPLQNWITGFSFITQLEWKQPILTSSFY